MRHSLGRSNPYRNSLMATLKAGTTTEEAVLAPVMPRNRQGMVTHHIHHRVAFTQPNNSRSSDGMGWAPRGLQL